MRPRTPFPNQRESGHSLIEFALVLPWLIILVFCTVDFGHLVQTRLILTNISREGGSIASRIESVDDAIADLLVASALPLKLNGPDGKLYVTRVAGGGDQSNPNPSIGTQISRGSLGVPSRIGNGQPNLGLSKMLHDHLVYDPAEGAGDIAEVTVVEVYYKYRPITPVANFLPGWLLAPGQDGIILKSKAVF